MRRFPRLRTFGFTAFAAAAMLPWPDGTLRAALGNAHDGGSDGAYLPFALTIAALLVGLTLLRRNAAPAPRPVALHPRLSPPALPAEPDRSHRERLAWHQLGAAVDHVSDVRKRAEAGMTGPSRPVPARARAMHRLIAQPEATLHRASAELGRKTDALLRQLRD